MSLPRSQLTVRQVAATAAVATILLALGFCLINNFIMSLRIAFAEDQTAIFDQMRRQTAESAAVDVTYLEYTLSYYPSGTKQTKDSRLDQVVERARQCAEREIIAIVRSRLPVTYSDPAGFDEFRFIFHEENGRIYGMFANLDSEMEVHRPLVQRLHEVAQEETGHKT
jgi:hypothetical protein